MTWYPDTVFERLIQRIVHLPWWLSTGLGLGLLSLPFGLAYLEQIRPVPLVQGEWRSVLFPTVGIAYIIAVAPAVWRAEQAVVAGLRPLLAQPPPAGGTGVWWRTSWGDWAAFGLGALGCVLLLVRSERPHWYWADWYIAFDYICMYGGLAWLIYAALSSARLTALLQRRLRPHNPFDLAPFAPVGRQALVLALIFVGAITLSLLFLYTPRLFFDWASLVIYSVLTLTTLSVFFGVMWPAHVTLARVKAQKQAAVQRLIGQTFDQLEAVLDAGSARQPLAAEFETWLTLEQRLAQTPTWPYNLEMLRTLALSVLTPLFVALFRVVGLWWSEGHL
jgi:hypothetical protein